MNLLNKLFEHWGNEDALEFLSKYSHDAKCRYWNMRLFREDGLDKLGLKRLYPDEYKKWMSKRMSAIARKVNPLPLSYQEFRLWLYKRRVNQ